MKTMTTAIAIAAALAAGPVLAQSGASGEQSSSTPHAQQPHGQAHPMPHGGMKAVQVEKMVAGWPQASKDAIRHMTKTYGPPAAVTADMAVWGQTGQWKRTFVFREEVQHDFPMPHKDVMQQWADFKVPADKADEIVTYDGSVVLERTAGEAAARCDNEGANFLALNLAHEIANGKRSVEDARKKYGEQIKAMKSGQDAPYTKKLMFSAPADAGDPGTKLEGM
jgi:hypothetical protein